MCNKSGPTYLDCVEFDIKTMITIDGYLYNVSKSIILKLHVALIRSIFVCLMYFSAFAFSVQYEIIQESKDNYKEHRILSSTTCERLSGTIN